MPIIDNNLKPMQTPIEGLKTRRFVNEEIGAVNLTVGELVMEHGSALRLHTHPTDEAIVLLEGRIEMVVGDEQREVLPGHTLLAPPGVPHRLINNTGASARLYTIFPTNETQTEYVD